jgi:hypothetical protein
MPVDRGPKVEDIVLTWRLRKEQRTVTFRVFRRNGNIHEDFLIEGVEWLNPVTETIKLKVRHARLGDKYTLVYYPQDRNGIMTRIQPKVTCLNCQAEQEQGANFCDNCGTPLTPSEPAPNLKPWSDNKVVEAMLRVIATFCDKNYAIFTNEEAAVLRERFSKGLTATIEFPISPVSELQTLVFETVPGNIQYYKVQVYEAHPTASDWINPGKTDYLSDLLGEAQGIAKK